MLLWGHPETYGGSCIPAYLQVPLASSSFPGPPSGTLTCSWPGSLKVGDGG